MEHFLRHLSLLNFNFIYMKKLLFFLIILVQFKVQAQQAIDVYQLSGMTVSLSHTDPVPFAKVQVKGKRRGTISNAEGFFSLPVTKEDTIVFSSLGYHPSVFIVRDYLKDYNPKEKSSYLYVIQILKEDSIVLPDVHIYPYKNAEELKTALLNMPLPSERYEQLARLNVNPDLLRFYMSDLPVNDEEKLKIAQKAYQDMYASKNLYSNQFDPLKAVRLVDYLMTKTKNDRKKATLDYWPD